MARNPNRRSSMLDLTCTPAIPTFQHSYCPPRLRRRFVLIDSPRRRSDGPSLRRTLPPDPPVSCPFPSRSANGRDKRARAGQPELGPQPTAQPACAALEEEEYVAGRGFWATTCATALAASVGMPLVRITYYEETGALFADLVAGAPKVHIQLLLVVMQALWWCVFTQIAHRRIRTWMRTAPMYPQWIELNTKAFEAIAGIKPATFLEEETGACMWLAVLCQHGVGGLLCVPSLLGIFSPATTAALACHGALCEAGWELQDILTRSCSLVLEGESAKSKNPPSLLLILMLHHAMGLIMVIPMNLHYGQEALYHEMVFLLQFAGAFAGFAQQYGYTLDVSSSCGLQQMRLSCLVTWCAIVHTRFVRFWVVGLKLLAVFGAHGDNHFLWAGGAVLGLMGVFNLLVCCDVTSKLFKFARQKCC